MGYFNITTGEKIVKPAPAAPEVPTAPVSEPPAPGVPTPIREGRKGRYFKLNEDQPDPLTLAGSAKALGNGIVNGLYAMAAAPGEIDELSRIAGHWLAEKAASKKLPMPPTIGEMATGALGVKGGEGYKVLPRASDLINDPVIGREGSVIKKVLPQGLPQHVPGNKVEEYIDLGGSMLPSAVAFGANPTTLLKSGVKEGVKEGVKAGARYAVAPTLAAAAARENPVLKGTPWADPAAALAMFAAGLGGGWTSAKRAAEARLSKIFKNEPKASIMEELAGNPNLRLPDVSDTAQMEAQGLVSGVGKPAGVLVQSAKKTMNAAPDVVREATQEAFGPGPSAWQVRKGLMDTAKANAAREFPAALNGAGPVNVTPVIQKIDDLLYPGATKFTGKPATAPDVIDQQLMKARSYLVDAKGSQLTDATKLHDIQQVLRQTATALFKRGGLEARAGYKLNEVRQSLIDQIDQATGGRFRRVQRLYSDDMGAAEAFDKGFDVFRNRAGVKGVVEDSPDALEAWLKTASKAERDAMVDGTKAAVEQMSGSLRNPILGAEKQAAPVFNQEKLRLILGKKRADEYIRMIRGQWRMYNTNFDWIKGSQTARRQISHRDLSDKAPMANTMGGLGLTGTAAATGAALLPAAPLVGAALGAGGAQVVLRGGREAIRYLKRARNLEMAKALAEQGPARPRVDALSVRPERTAAAAGTVASGAGLLEEDRRRKRLPAAR